MKLFIFSCLLAISFAQTVEPNTSEQRLYAYGTPDTEDDCPSGYSLVIDEFECAEASSALGGTFSGVGNWPVPQFCVADLSDGGTFYYNTRVGIEGVAHRRPVCISRVTISQTTEAEEPTASTTGAPTVSNAPTVEPTGAPTPIPYRVFVKFISSYGCAINAPRIAAMEWNFYEHENATDEIGSEYFDFTGNLDSPTGEFPENLSDDDENTKWLSFLDCNGDGDECVCTNELELHFTLMDRPTHYAFVSGDHGQLRDPAIWNVTFCCAVGSSVDNPFGCGEPQNVNVFDQPWSDIYGPNLGRIEETGRFPLGQCEHGPSFAPSYFESTRLPTKSPHTSMPSIAPFSPSDAPSPAPVYQDYFEWNCTAEDEPTTCEEYTRGLTQECYDAPAPHNSTNDYCCSVSDGSQYCCEYYDPNDPNNIWVGEDVARCEQVDSQCIQTCFKSLYDGTRRTCHKMCPDSPTEHPSTKPSALCEDQDEVYSMNGTTYWDETSNKTMTCEQVIDILFVNNDLNCTNHFARQCPVACNSCMQIPSQNPTANPSRPPQEPSISPTFGPSRSPHPQCADDDPVIIGGIELSGNCTELTKQLLGGEPCSDSLARVCEKSCPNACTDYPTLFPFTSPSTSPTTTPSKDPTSSNPTMSPSRTPSKTPSKIPTANPSQAPNLDCADVDVVTFFGGQELGFGISCRVAVQVVFDNNDVCQGDLLRQCPDSCGTCTDEPSKAPSTMPSIDCYDRYPVFDAENQELPNLDCGEIVFVLEEQFGSDNPCTEHYALQCPYSCGLCTPMPTGTPVISEPSVTPSVSIPTQSPTMNTTFVPSQSKLPSVSPSYAGPYQCGDNIAQCDVGFTTLFAALILCQNQAYEDCPEIYDQTTVCPELICPDVSCPDCPAVTNSCECPASTCEECPECPTTENPQMEYVDQVETYDASQTCDEATDWWVGQVLEGLQGFDPDTMTLCQVDGEYKIFTYGRVYPTCVAYGDPTAVCTDSDLMCPEVPSTQGTFGWPGNQRAFLQEALLRNDFKHQDCPTIQDECEPLEAVNAGYWKDLWVTKTGLDVSYMENICVDPATTEVRYVMADMYMNTCMGFSTEAQTACPTPRSFLCAGSLEGFVTYGWPGQIVEAIGRAVEQTDSKRHPQCPF